MLDNYVYAGTELIHAGTPPQYIPDLMRQLFTWSKESKLHLLVKSCIFHYDFEFIHPFADENGRLGNASNTAGESTFFVEFSLKVIRDLLLELSENDTGGVNIQYNFTEDKMLALLRQNERHSAKSLVSELGISER